MLTGALTAHPGLVGYVTDGDGGGGSGDPTPTVWIGPGGNNGNPGTYESPWLTQAYAITQMGAGAVLGMKNGTYTDGWTSLPVGVSGNECHIVAEDDGSVIVTGGLSLSTNTTWWSTVRGILFNNAAQKSVVGKRWSFLRCGFRGSQATGNVSTLAVGTGDFTPGADYGLLEDCWAFGPGGRYKFLVYNSDNMLVRRVVARHDGGWTYDNSNPQAGIAIYNSNCVAIHPIVIDSTVGLTAHEAEFYMPHNTDNGNTYMNVHVVGGMVIKAQASGFKPESSPPIPYTISCTHCLVFAGNSTGRGIVINAANSHMTVDRCTVINGIDGYAAYQPGSTLTVTGSIVEDADDAINGATVSGSNNRGWNNAGGDDGLTQLDPEANGLTYPMRIEAGSTLAGIPCGADIRKKIGLSGARLGDANWLTPLGDDLWPWPNQARIYTEMGAVSTRGFCGVGEDLTHYIANLLGNGSPY